MCVEEKTIADLVSITKEVLRLHQDEQYSFSKLCVSDELVKASYFVCHIFDLPSQYDQQPLPGGSTKFISHKPTVFESHALTNAVDRAKIDHLMTKIQNLEEHNKRLQEQIGVNATIAQEFEQTQAQVHRLTEKSKSQKDLTVSSGN